MKQAKKWFLNVYKASKYNIKCKQNSIIPLKREFVTSTIPAFRANLDNSL